MIGGDASDTPARASVPTFDTYQALEPTAGGPIINGVDHTVDVDGDRL